MSDHDERLRELGSELPWDKPDPARRDAVRSSLLVAAAERDMRPATRWYLIGGAFAAGALAAAAVVLVVLHGANKPTPVASAARIDASPAAQFDRQVTRTPTGVDEVVRVRAGTLTMAVGALRAGDHVRIATRDAEVEGQGNYAVAVVGDQLQEVRVKDGQATIRITGQQAVFLSTGQSWSAHSIIARDEVARAVESPVPAVEPAPVAPVVGPPGPVAPVVEPRPPVARIESSAPVARVESPVPVARVESRAPVAAPKRVVPRVETKAETVEAPLAHVDSVTAPIDSPVAAPSEAPRAPTAGPKEVERRFQSGMALLKAGKAADAARELVAAADAGGDDPLAADARYFAAVALTKAGRKTEAERALVSFIDRAPTSIRRGRAAVMLARLIAERGDNTAARAWFESALGDADASVVAAARAGIAGLH